MINESMEKPINMTCIICPMGCALEVTKKDGRFDVKGNTCPRGEKYAEKELTNPTRTLTCAILVEGGKIRMVPAKSSVEIPRDLQKECMEVVKRSKVKAPVKTGDVLIKNILDTGADIIACIDC